MSYTPNIRPIDGKQYIFCDWRRKFVRLTPEEWVRQNILHSLVEDIQYPMSMLAVEQPIKVGSVQKRCDAVVYSPQLTPLCIIEFKAESVALTQQVFDQVAIYNRRLQVEHLLISNGNDTYFCQVLPHTFRFLPTIPTYTELCRNKS